MHAAEFAWPTQSEIRASSALRLLSCMQADPLYIGIFVSSMLFPALASIIKEKIFADAKEQLDGQPLDIFVVNSFGSGAQAVGVLLLLPVLTSLRGLSLSELPQYVGDGMCQIHFKHYVTTLSRHLDSRESTVVRNVCTPTWSSSCAAMANCD